MQRSSPKFSLARVLCAVVFVVLLGYFALVGPHAFSSHSPTEARVKVDILNYTAALMAYSNTYSSLPIGDNATVTTALMGKNPERHYFLPTQLLNARGEFLDPKQQPYDIEVTTNT